MSNLDTITTVLATALPIEQRHHAAALASLLDDLAAGLVPADVTRRLVAQPVLVTTLAALAGQKFDIAGRPLHIAGSVGNLQQITISGGYIENIVGTMITIQLPSIPRSIDPVAAQELLAALPLDSIPPIAPLPELHSMPLARNPLFVGREDNLRTLAAALKGEGTTAVIGQATAITGMGGIGKTNTATEFVHRYGQFFAGGVFWLSFADPASIPLEIVTCGQVLELPGFSDLKLDEQVQRVLTAWAQSLPRLLVFDNCDDTVPGQAEMLLKEWRPTSGGCRVLITSRRATWSQTMGITKLPLNVLSRVESIALLCKHRPDLHEGDLVLNDIAQELGDLPLALHLSGSFLETYRESPTFGAPANLLTELRNIRLLDHDALQGIDVTPSPTNHDLHVARTFALSYNRLNIHDPVDALALTLLARAACLAPGEPIPRALLLRMLGLAEEHWAAERQGEKGLLRLIALGMFKVVSDGMLSMHRLIVNFVQKVNQGVQAEQFVPQMFYDHLHRANDSDVVDERLPGVHIRYVVDQALERAEKLAVMNRALKREEELAYELVYDFSRYLYILGNYQDALRYVNKVGAWCERRLPPDSWRLAQMLSSRATLLERLKSQEDIDKLYREAIELLEKVGGKQADEPPELLPRIYNNFAVFLTNRKDYSEALRCVTRGLELRKTRLDNKHFHIGVSYTNLALIHHYEARLDEALENYTEALKIFKEAGLVAHGHMALTLQNVGEIYSAREEHETARRYFDDARAIYEQSPQAWSDNHAYTLYHLGQLFLLQ